MCVCVCVCRACHCLNVYSTTTGPSVLFGTAQTFHFDVDTIVGPARPAAALTRDHNWSIRAACEYLKTWPTGVRIDLRHGGEEIGGRSFRSFSRGHPATRPWQPGPNPFRPSIRRPHDNQYAPAFQSSAPSPLFNRPSSAFGIGAAAAALGCARAEALCK